MKSLVITLAVSLSIVILFGCNQNRQPRDRWPVNESDSTVTQLIPYDPDGNHEYVTVAFNGIPMRLLWDTGCTTTTMPISEFLRLIKEDKINNFDYDGLSYSKIADGSIMKNFKYNINTVTFNTTAGKAIEFRDVSVLVSSDPNAALLLGKNVIDLLGECHRDETKTCFVVKK